MLPFVLLLALFAACLILFLSYFVLLWKRMLLSFRLKKLVKKTGGELIWHRNPFLSVFSGQKGTDFELLTPKLHYRVSLLSARHKLREHSFASPREVYLYRRFRLFAVAGKRVRYRINEFNFGTSLSCLSIDLAEKTEEGVEKVLLCYPVPNEVTAIKGTKKVPVGNGDELYCGYRFMTLSGFLEEAERGEVYRRSRNAWDAQ